MLASQQWTLRCTGRRCRAACRRFVDLADLVDGRVLQDADAGVGEDLGDFLRFAERVGVDDRRDAVGEGARATMSRSSGDRLRRAAGRR